jgi:sodium/bile acid cotransporter 7
MGLVRPPLPAPTTLRVLAAGLVLTACTAAGTDDEKLTRLQEMVATVDETFPEVEQLTVEQVGRLVELDQVVLVDVRDEKERRVSMIPGAVSAEEFEANPDTYVGRVAVAYCTIGHRSSEFAKRLTASGRPVANLAGSILAWAHAGGPLVSDGVPTRKLHVYGSRWNLAPEDYETTW